MEIIWNSNSQIHKQSFLGTQPCLLILLVPVTVWLLKYQIWWNSSSSIQECLASWRVLVSNAVWWHNAFVTGHLALLSLQPPRLSLLLRMSVHIHAVSSASLCFYDLANIICFIVLQFKNQTTSPCFLATRNGFYTLFCLYGHCFHGFDDLQLFPISDVSLSFLNTIYLFKSIPITSSSEGLLCLGTVLGIGM